MMRVLFMGTGEIALPAFQMLRDGDQLVGLVTQPDRPVGRSGKPRAPRIKELAQEASLPVLQPERVRSKKALAAIAELQPDVVVVMAYGQILPSRLLELPARGCINVHASLLPRHRGASCVQAAIEAGDAESGLTVMYMAEGLDTGDIILARALPIFPDETGGSLHDRLALLAPPVLSEALALIQAGAAPRQPQDDALATYAPKLARADGEIDWSLPAEQLARRVRAYDPWPGTFTTWESGRGTTKRLKVFPEVGVRPVQGAPGEVLAADSHGIAIGCGSGALILQSVQPEGARRMSAEEFLRGQPLAMGDRFFSLEKNRE